MSGEIQALLEELLPKRTDSKEKKSFIRDLLEWKEKFALHGINRPKIVPFSTESSADKVFLTLVPLIASTGIIVPKFSEHEITSKNSILDKLESIPGFQTSLNPEEIKIQLSKTGAVMLIVPESINSSFKKIYPTEEVPPLKDPKKLLCAIATIILTGDVKGAVLDIKVACGTLIKNAKDARNMARSLKKICSRINVRTSYILSDMNQPVGQAIGSSLELIEALELLKGKGPLDVLKIALELGTEMLLLAEKVPDRIAAKKLLKNKIINGEALEKFKEIIKAQRGNARIIDDYSILPLAREKIKIASQNKGYIQNIRIDRIYFIGKELGVFRKRQGYPIDHGSGFLIHKKIGDWVEKNEILAEVYSNTIKDRSWIEKEFRKALAISPKPPDFRPFIIERN
jgi:pyrimidine-nucleoside phosphorylase